MSFRLRIDHVETRDGETVIRGRVIAGSYFGPQYVRVTDATGVARTALILTHSMIEPKGWPVTSEHETQLELCIASPPAPFVIDRSGIVDGLGSVAPREASTDLSGELSNPLLWANFSVLHMASEAMEQPYVDFLGLSQEQVNRYYLEVIEPLIDSPACPIFLLDIDCNRYIEIEWAGGLEPQNRVWIGSRTPGQRALLGYDSGHFSLPGLRPSELVWLLDRLEQSATHPAAGLMIVPMCYLPEPDAKLTERLARLCARIPSANPMLASTMAANMLKHLVVPDASWERKAGYGWYSNWRYSQRNPQSLLSILSPAEFTFIDQFFTEVS